jgi:ribonucleoside-diphosphate reductase alpha chain
MLKIARKTEQVPVYDFTVEDNHNFYCNGALVHNCGEIILRPQEFCNLTEVVIRDGDSLDDLKRKVRIATILGTFQSTLTNFRYLRSVWKRNVEEERLLGVSLTGIMDHEILNSVNDKTAVYLDAMREHSITVNVEWSNKLGIPQSAAITTVKPSGTVSQLVDSSSGIHPRMSRHYIRTVRNDKKDPLSKFMIDQGIPHESDVMKETNWVFSFPMKSPSHARLASEMSAIDQLEHYLIFNEHWTEHNPSITVYVRDHEWMEVGTFVYKHFENLNGVSFLPYSEHNYLQAPYQPITEDKYLAASDGFPIVDFDKFNVNEHEDNTVGVQNLACAAGGCEI